MVIGCVRCNRQAVIRQLVDFRDVTEKDAFGVWQSRLELKNISDRETTEFYLVHESGTIYGPVCCSMSPFLSVAISQSW